MLISPSKQKQNFALQIKPQDKAASPSLFPGGMPQPPPARMPATCLAFHYLCMFFLSPSRLGPLEGRVTLPCSSLPSVAAGSGLGIQ